MSSTAVSLPQGGVYDVTVFGATGFVGQLCIRHLVDHPDFTSGAFTWAIAGRSASKLYSLKQKYSLPASVGIIEADTSKPLEGGLEKMVKQSRVVMNLVGPYSDYGSFHLAELCAQHGVSYTDLSGESLYNKNLVEKLHETAKKSGATLLPSVGYDSLPADLSVYLGARRVLENAEKKGAQVGHIEATAGGSVMGSASGGTLASWRSMVSGSDPWQMLWQKPTAICDSLYKSSSSPKPTSEILLRYAQWLPQCNGYGALNPLGIHNARAVYHTAALLNVEPDSDDRKTKYSPTFQFVDLLVHAARAPSPISWLVAIIASSAVRIVALLMANSALVRSLSAKLVPVGTGPSEKAQRDGFVNMKTLVVGWKSVDDVKGGQQRTPIAASVARWKASKADPGYLMTSRVISEVSLLVAFDRKNGDKKIHSGVRTGATMSKNPAPLVERLQKYAKIDIGVEDWDYERKGVFNSLAGASSSTSSVAVASAEAKDALPLSLPADPTNSSPYPHCPAGYIPLSETDGDIIQITYEPLDIGKMTEEVSSRWAGAVVAFLGMTRDDRTAGKGEEEGECEQRGRGQ
ncbi:hypothetical protein BCV69DRAFT_220498 [Microstroma glucosiphilum]|uniref:Saccharopine dehydrogenase NADP binding domain-containing protein n=1 Tax=Pseudomicrostroma glucosiphilum TaxID=1684307 RepID=A0A316U4D0_9BASI|nr:hypothetical protein BCV69DRAFT_220498 [Pseudomicrostroma glucosiphilum]PWN20126.1 hypothetical protein BCV69DRAFT_220498 [Pseudomicrostroma glucosiphilum]